MEYGVDVDPQCRAVSRTCTASLMEKFSNLAAKMVASKD